MAGKVIVIPVGKFHDAFVDEEDADWVLARSWYPTMPNPRNPRLVYAKCGKNSKYKRAFLHRLIMNAPKGIDVDHRNHNGLDCRRDNLRLATRGLNNANNRRPPGFSGYRGVYFVSRAKSKPWLARVKSDRKEHYLGLYETAEMAARAYDNGALRFHGEFATLNFPKGV